METLYPTSSHILNSDWFNQNCKSKWTREENRMFESLLAIYDKETPDRWLRMADMIPGKTEFDVIEQYQELVEDITDIEAGLVPLPGYETNKSSFTMKVVNDCALSSFKKRSLSYRSTDHERKKGVPWTEDEHRRFLMGLQKYGKGDWRNISRNFVITKTPTQVASHAQKYYARLKSEGKEKRRPSIHDIRTVHLVTTENRIRSPPTNSNHMYSPKMSQYLNRMVFESAHGTAFRMVSNSGFQI
jgi:SHAQKYF class myb-like DNA-binding protein